MRRIAVINQKGGVGKTTTTANLGAALAQQGRRVVVVDMDAQANLSLSLDRETTADQPSTYTVLVGSTGFERALRPTSLPGLSLLSSNLDLSGAELELAGAIGREFLMRDAIREWERDARARDGRAPADYVIFDCPPSLGLLSINALAASGEVLITLQTEFLALQGMSKLVEVVQLLRRRLNPELEITGILPCLYDSRLKLAREVLGEIRTYFPGLVFPHPVRSNVKLAEAPSYGKTIFEYAPDSNGAADYRLVAREMIAREGQDPDLAGLPPFEDRIVVPESEVAVDAVRSQSMLRSANAALAEKRARAADARATEELRAATLGSAAGTELARTPEEAPLDERPSAAVSPSGTEAVRAELIEDASDADEILLEPSFGAALDARAVPDLAGPSRPLERPPATHALDPEHLLLDAQSVRDVLDPAPLAPGNGPGRDGDAAVDELSTDADADSDYESETETETETLREVVLSPAPRASERRSVRLEDLPALPPDAFLILTSYVYEG